MLYRPQRVPADTGLKITCAGTVRNAQLVNISVSGARLDCVGPLPQDEPIILHFLHERFDARVVWSNPHRTGVRFIVPLSQATVNALRGARSQAASTWGTLGHRFRELS
jgi:hypothetical protein